MTGESQEPTGAASLSRWDNDRRTRIVVYAVILGTVFLGYSIPFVGIALSAVAAAIVASERRDIWHVALTLP